MTDQGKSARAWMDPDARWRNAIKFLNDERRVQGGGEDLLLTALEALAFPDGSGEQGQAVLRAIARAAPVAPHVEPPALVFAPLRLIASGARA